MNNQRNAVGSEERLKESIEKIDLCMPLTRDFECQVNSDLEKKQSAKKRKGPQSTIRKRKCVETAADAPAPKKSDNKHLNLSSEKQDSTLKSADKTLSGFPLALSSSALNACCVFSAPETETQNSALNKAVASSTSAASGCSVSGAPETKIQGLPNLENDLLLSAESPEEKIRIFEQIQEMSKKLLEAKEHFNEFKSCLLLAFKMMTETSDAKECQKNL